MHTVERVAHMNKHFARGAALIGAAAVLTMANGAGLASADGLNGMTYKDASKYLSDAGSTVVIATVVGDQLATDDCIVTHWRLNNNDKTKALVYLNCNAGIAAGGDAGNSAMSPEGKKAKLDAKRAANITKNPDMCEASEDAKTWCISLCERTKLCTYEG